MSLQNLINHVKLSKKKKELLELVASTWEQVHEPSRDYLECLNENEKESIVFFQGIIFNWFQ